MPGSDSMHASSDADFPRRLKSPHVAGLGDCRWWPVLISACGMALIPRLHRFPCRLSPAACTIYAWSHAALPVGAMVHPSAHQSTSAAWTACAFTIRLTGRTPTRLDTVGRVPPVTRTNLEADELVSSPDYDPGLFPVVTCTALRFHAAVNLMAPAIREFKW